MNDERDRAREGLPPPTAPYLPVQTGRVHVTGRIGRVHRGSNGGDASPLRTGG